MAEWDLSQKIIPYLDRHLAFPLLAYLTETGLFSAEEVQVAQFELARKTNMVDFAVNLFEAVYPGKEIPAGEFCSLRRWGKESGEIDGGPDRVEFNEKRQEALLTNERLQQDAQAVLDVIENPDVAQALRQDKNQNLQYLKENYNVRFLHTPKKKTKKTSQALPLVF